jgi:hypothetical protein
MCRKDYLSLEPDKLLWGERIGFNGFHSHQVLHRYMFSFPWGSSVLTLHLARSRRRTRSASWKL